MAVAQALDTRIVLIVDSTAELMLMKSIIEMMLSRSREPGQLEISFSAREIDVTARRVATAWPLARSRRTGVKTPSV